MNFDQQLHYYMEYFDEFYRCIEYYKLNILVFQLSDLDICEKKKKKKKNKKKKPLEKVLLWNILIKLYAVKNTMAKGHFSA